MCIVGTPLYLLVSNFIGNRSAHVTIMRQYIIKA